MSADRNLLFGILALQLDLNNRDQLAAGMNAWVIAKWDRRGPEYSYLTRQCDQTVRLLGSHAGKISSLVMRSLKCDCEKKRDRNVIDRISKKSARPKGQSDRRLRRAVSRKRRGRDLNP